MSASRASAAFRVLALLLVLGPAGAALAQQEPLVETQPLAPPAPAESPAPEAGEGPQSLLAPLAGGAPRPEELATVPAQAAAADEGLGLLDENGGGFGPTLWEGTDRTLLENLLPQLPVGTASPTLFSLTRRLLLSDAPLPPPAEPTGETNAAIDLLDLRLERLAALGVMGELERLLALLPPERSPDVRKRLTVELLLTEGNETAACELVRQGDPTGGSDLFWLKALSYCQFRAGETAAAELGLALLRDLGREQDMLFVRLLSAALGLYPLQAEELDALPAGQLRSLELALLTSLQRPFPQALLTGGAPRARMQLALDDSVPLAARAPATEWAVSSQRLSAEHLAALYDSFEFEATTLDDALNAGYRLPGVEARALYFQALQKPGGPQQELLTAELALDSAEADGVYVGMAEVVLPELDADPDDSGLAWLAAMLGRANYVLGRYEAATAWLLLAKREAPVSAQAAAASLRLWPYARLAGTTRFANEAGVDGWRYAQNDPASEEVAAQAAFLEVLFQALGEADAVAWAEPAEEESVTGGSAVPAADALVALEEASRAGRLGETVLRVLVLLGEGDPAEVQPQALGAALSALMQVGLPLEARALAIEAALGKGI